MTQCPSDLVAILTRFGQSHLISGWDGLTLPDRERFVAESRAVDFAALRDLFERRNDPAAALPSRDRMTPIPVETWDEIGAASKAIGESALRNGLVAALVVAGGQGTRLGFDHPKGMFPIGPVSNATLFQYHAEKVANLRRTYGGAVPFLVMTSPATHDETVAFFETNEHFGLNDVHFFQQATMPVLDLATGRVLLERPGKLFLSPNGHGGTLTALADTGLLATLKTRGIEHVFYFQVDNPLVRVCDPAFVGRHIESASDASSKVVFKTEPDERVGVLALVDGRCSIVEYSDLPMEMSEERDANGDLAFRAGSPAIHCFSLAFLERVTSGADRLSFHVARKKVPHYDPEAGIEVTPETENALKFELFVFDALPHATRWLAVSVNREDEFAPLKNASGADSAEDVKRALTRQAARWLTGAGIEVPLTADGKPRYPLEVGPNFAVSPEQFISRVSPDLTIRSPMCLR